MLSKSEVIKKFEPFLEFICSNQYRIKIIELLLKNKDVGYTISVSELKDKLKLHHSTVIYHLEKLQEYKLVEPVSQAGKRRYWRLDLKYPKWIERVHNYTQNRG